MKILTLGSINIDFNYSVAHITTPKETQGSTGLKMFPGGKGLNHALTLARAGMDVQLAGMIGEDGVQMLHMIEEAGVDTDMPSFRGMRSDRMQSCSTAVPTGRSMKHTSTRCWKITARAISWSLRMRFPAWSILSTVRMKRACISCSIRRHVRRSCCGRI